MRITRKSCFYLAISSLAFTPSLLFAAVSVNAAKQPVTKLLPYLQQNTNNRTGNQFIAWRRSAGLNNSTHVRLQQQFRNIPVFGGEVIVHSNAMANRAQMNTTVTGRYYEKLEQDLSSPPSAQAREESAKQVVAQYQQQDQTGASITDLKSNLIVYVRQDNQRAVFAYHISFAAATADGIVALPNKIIDAQTGATYLAWDNREIVQQTNVTSSEIEHGGGIGGNVKIGKLSYDDSDAAHRGFNVTRKVSLNPLSKDFRGRCYLDNEASSVSIYSLWRDLANIPFEESAYACINADPNHHNLYWDNDDQTINEGYSPYNDAMYGSELVLGLYKDWYGMAPVTLDDHKTAMKLPLIINTIPNAAWNPNRQRLELGLSTSKIFPGAKAFYPFTSPGVMAHEISHAFTSQHSNLIYQGGSGAMNEAFSDMADQALKFYTYGKNDWRIGSEIVRDPTVLHCQDASDCALRYMDQPTRDGISADNVVDGFMSSNVHYSSGVFNKLFYTLATQPGWSVRKAFDVMLNANANYWTSGTGTNEDFKPIACGIIASAKDYQSKDSSYNVSAVITAVKAVGFIDNGDPQEPLYALIDIKDCE